MRFALDMCNPFGHALSDQRVWCYLPASNPGEGQRLSDVQVSMPHQKLTDPLGHQILLLELDTVAPYAQKRVSVTTLVETDPLHTSTALNNPAPWLHAERFIESDAPRIQRLARQLQSSTSALTVRAIYEWVQTNLRYAGYIAEDLGALYALDSGGGDCTEYADLVVALARAAGIPARMIGGYVADRDKAVRPQDYHNWAEVFFDGRWQIVDAQKENWLPTQGNYIAFRIYRDIAINSIGLAHRFHVGGSLAVVLK
ncbi:MAG: transglutaminase domain-containing protein [Pseudomonadales bacterium]|nr:transglutaminase domain-containing protein [Pseudomonadales bacterium]